MNKHLLWPHYLLACILFLCTTECTTNPHNNIVYIAHFPGSNPHNDFFKPDHARDNICKPFCDLYTALIKNGYTVRFIYDGHAITPHSAVLSFNNIDNSLLRDIKKTKHVRAVLCVFEPPVVCPQLHNEQLSDYFDITLLLSNDRINQTTRKTFYYPQPYLRMISQDIPFCDKTLCAMMACNKYSSHPNELYSTRRNIAAFLSAYNPKEFHLYGTGWGANPCWKGTVPHKGEVLKRYKFALCFENMGKQKGYITEKIFDCMVAGCVPVYLGAEDITNYVPANTFIDMRLFSNYKDLYIFLSTMPQEIHEQYIRNIQAFLQSKQADLFSIDTFIQTILKALEAS